jgi:hypothetical protein
MPRGEEGGESDHQLGLKDYLALFIAMLQTVVLPLLVLIVILVVFVVIAHYVR